MSLPTHWTAYEEGHVVPTRYIIFNDVLIPSKQFNYLIIRRTLNQLGPQEAPRYLLFSSNIINQQSLAHLHIFAKRMPLSESKTHKPNSQKMTSSQDFRQAKFCSEPQELPQPKPTQNKNWGLFKGEFIEKFCIKNTDIVITQELKRLKMTGTIDKYIAAYQDNHNRIPSHKSFCDSFTFYFMKHLITNLQEIFQGVKHAAQKSRHPPSNFEMQEDHKNHKESVFQQADPSHFKF
ncbi:hypothetical protein DSO57_1036993 [Entomophthora muscae]|uniref:Uncharacterized protein n=1 Tax=Entomophthora muscae TaxID=34485 RepID=A0ACC2S1B8_9FUNG|nr:hypothetical protein DSO57_1036993 [Entomophthora muscae]